MSGQYSPGQLDAIARERGFPDYATWQAWENHRSQALKGSNTVQSQPKNWLQQIFGVIHPLNYAADRINTALNGKR